MYDLLAGNDVAGTRAELGRSPDRTGTARFSTKAVVLPIARPVTFVQPFDPWGSQMRLFYGWVIVAVGIVVGCISMGGVMSLGVFLQPMADSLGWSHTGIATASTLAFLWMGVGGFLWGWLYDRYGARVVVLFGGLLQGLGLVVASQAQSLLVFLIVYGTAAGLAAGAAYVP
jgi:MFS family permease